MAPQTVAINYQSAVIQAFLTDTGRFFSVSEIIKIISEKHPIQPHRRTVRRVIAQLLAVPLLERRLERRHLRAIPINVYRYKN